MPEGQYVNIRLKRETRDRLVILGQKGQTYDDVVAELLAFFDGPNKGKDLVTPSESNKK